MSATILDSGRNRAFGTFRDKATAEQAIQNMGGVQINGGSKFLVPTLTGSRGAYVFVAEIDEVENLQGWLNHLSAGDGPNRNGSNQSRKGVG